MTPRAVLRTLGTVWSTLEPLDLPMAVLGGLALSVWKRLRTTHAVNLLIALEELDTDLLLETLQQTGELRALDCLINELRSLFVVRCVRHSG